jgi:tetratricopeptide (TPR) repeat protein
MKAHRVTVLGSLALAIALASWIVFAQGDTAAPSVDDAAPVEGDVSTWRAAREQVAGSWDQAEQLKTAGEYETASQQFQAIAAQLPDSSQKQRALLEAGLCLAEAGQPSLAVSLYDRVIDLGEALTVFDYYSPTGEERKPLPLGKGRKKTIKEWTAEALCAKATACRDTGDNAEALRAVQRVRAEYPGMRFIDHILRVQSELEGLSRQEVQDRLTREEEAVDSYEIGHVAYVERRYSDALAALDGVIASYPDTAIANKALRDKARSLWNSSSFDEAVTVYSQIVDRIGDVAPVSDLVREAESRVAWRRAGLMVKEYGTTLQSDGTVSDEQWREVQDLCLVAMRECEEAERRAEAHIHLIESMLWQHRFEDAFAQATLYFRHFGTGSSPKAYQVGRNTAWAHYFAGRALQHLGRDDEAFAQFQAVAMMPDEALAKGSLDDHVLPFVYSAMMRYLREAGATPEEIRELADEFVSRWPDSQSLKLISALRQRLAGQ